MLHISNTFHPELGTNVSTNSIVSQNSDADSSVDVSSHETFATNHTNDFVCTLVSDVAAFLKDMLEEVRYEFSLIFLA